jgi:hypothetical protein
MEKKSYRWGGLCSTMNPLRLIVTPCGNAYVAKAAEPTITAVGASPEQAVENARLAAVSIDDPDRRLSMLLVRIDEPRRSTIVMQPIGKMFSLAAIDGEVAWRYLATITTDDPSNRAG